MPHATRIVHYLLDEHCMQRMGGPFTFWHNLKAVAARMCIDVYMWLHIIFAYKTCVVDKFKLVVVFFLFLLLENSQPVTMYLSYLFTPISITSKQLRRRLMTSNYMFTKQTISALLPVFTIWYNIYKQVFLIV